MSLLDTYLAPRLEKRKEEGTLRTLKSNKSLIDFYSNDYLGLARSTELFDLIYKKYQLLSPKMNGATGSRLLSGNGRYIEALEEKLASIFKGKRALLFNSGYTANLGVISAITQKGDTILYDELSHACIKDGARLSLASRFSFRHNDLHDLENKIKKSTGKVFIAVEAAYSMDGDHCPLAEIVALKKKYDINIILDEAHSTGILGENGSGFAASLNLEQHIDIRIYTFGKAMGVHGACVVGSEKLIEYLINFARPFIYTTAMSPHAIVAIDAAFEFLTQNLNLQNVLKEKVNLFITDTDHIKNRTLSYSPIQTIILNGGSHAKSLAEQLQANGFDIRAILSPTVPKGKERLRICLHAFNSDADIIRLAKALT
jgi:8-amino-7-oxononanoate synthase